jgi:hypothetical protein
VEWIAAGVEWPARSGVVIDARSEIGVLVIQSGGPGTSNGTVYCLRVLDEHTVIVQWRSSWKT